jgi:hypothetical protein
MRQVFIHLHIPKCGGSAVVDLLWRNFVTGLGTTNSILNSYQYDTKQVARIIDYHPDLKCLTGHKLSLNLPFDRKDFDLQAFTWIRDPVDLFVSHYFYHRNHTTLVPEAKKMDLPEYTEWALKHGNQDMYINRQTKFLSGGSIKKIESMVSEEKVFLFPLERLQESIYTLAHRFPHAFVDLKIRRTNISKKDQEIPDGFRNMVLPYVEEDMRLLELARQTKMENKGPDRKFNFSRHLHLAPKKMSLNVVRLLRRLASNIEKRC